MLIPAHPFLIKTNININKNINVNVNALPQNICDSNFHFAESLYCIISEKGHLQ